MLIPTLFRLFYIAEIHNVVPVSDVHFVFNSKMFTLSFIYTYIYVMFLNDCKNLAVILCYGIVVVICLQTEWLPCKLKFALTECRKFSHNIWFDESIILFDFDDFHFCRYTVVRL